MEEELFFLILEHLTEPFPNHGFRYGRWVTRKVAVLSIATIWLLAGLISFVPISLGLHRPSLPVRDDHGRPTCALDLAPTYAVVSSCISFYVPTVVMLGIYLRLYMYAQKHVRNIRAVTKPVRTSDCSSANSVRVS